MMISVQAEKANHENTSGPPARAHGMGPADNMTAEQLRELASEVKQGLWLGTE